MKNRNDEAEELDKKCAWRDDETGERCGGYHTKTSAFCNVHSGGLAKMNEARRRNADIVRELKENIDFDIDRIETLQDVKAALSKLYNAVKLGLINKDRAQTMIMILTQMQKVLEKKSGPAGASFVNINIETGAAAKITANFATTRELDEFLLAGEQASVKLLEDLQSAGKLEVGEPEPVAEPEPEAPPIIDLFSLPQLHDWKGQYEVVSKDIAQLVYTCQICGKTSPNKTKEECNG